MHTVVVLPPRGNYTKLHQAQTDIHSALAALVLHTLIVRTPVQRDWKGRGRICTEEQTQTDDYTSELCVSGHTASWGRLHAGSYEEGRDGEVTGAWQTPDLLEKFEGLDCVATAGKEVFEDVICDWRTVEEKGEGQGERGGGVFMRKRTQLK